MSRKPTKLNINIIFPEVEECGQATSRWVRITEILPALHRNIGRNSYAKQHTQKEGAT